MSKKHKKFSQKSKKLSNPKKSNSTSKNDSREFLENKIRKKLIDDEIISSETDFQLANKNIGIILIDEEKEIERSDSNLMKTPEYFQLPEKQKELLDLEKNKDLKKELMSETETFQMNQVTFDNPDFQQTISIVDSQRVSDYLPKSKLIKLEKTDVGFSINEFDSKGKLTSQLIISFISPEMDEDKLNNYNVGQLRALIKDSPELKEKISNYNSLSKSKLRMRIRQELIILANENNIDNDNNNNILE